MTTLIQPIAVDGQEAMRASRWRAVIWICALQVLDIVTTLVAIHMVGASEGNPLMVWLVETKLFILVKASVCAWVIWTASRRQPVTTRTLALAWFAVGSYVLAIILNTQHIIKG
jgi:predicted lysophospholipase L1 biosynthesis ABC-type transport system permease subunit